MLQLLHIKKNKSKLYETISIKHLFEIGLKLKPYLNSEYKIG